MPNHNFSIYSLRWLALSVLQIVLLVLGYSLVTPPWHQLQQQQQIEKQMKGEIKLSAPVSVLANQNNDSFTCTVMRKSEEDFFSLLVARAHALNVSIKQLRKQADNIYLTLSGNYNALSLYVQQTLMGNCDVIIEQLKLVPDKNFLNMTIQLKIMK